MPIYKQFEVVVVPFPFTDRRASKKRPALVLSNHREFSIDKSILSMITTAEHESWSLDTKISDLNSAGLREPSIIRFKLFTLEDNLIIKRIGSLGRYDCTVIKARMGKLFGFVQK